MVVCIRARSPAPLTRPATLYYAARMQMQHKLLVQTTRPNYSCLCVKVNGIVQEVPPHRYKPCPKAPSYLPHNFAPALSVT